jgi:hypothetical protein
MAHAMPPQTTPNKEMRNDMTMTIENDTETITSSTVELESKVLVSINSLLVFAEPKSGDSPIIQGVKLMRSGNQLIALATNRYVLVKAAYDNVTFSNWEDDTSVWLDHDTLKQATAASKYNPLIMVTIGNTPKTPLSLETTYIAIGSWEGATRFTHTETTASRYPAIEKLIPESEPNGAATLSVNPKWLAMLSKIVVPEYRPAKDTPWLLSFWSKDGHKFMPMLAEMWQDNAYRIQVLIQPNLIKR